jgi:hypothetical protein
MLSARKALDAAGAHACWAQAAPQRCLKGIPFRRTSRAASSTASATRRAPRLARGHTGRPGTSRTPISWYRSATRTQATQVGDARSKLSVLLSSEATAGGLILFRVGAAAALAIFTAQHAPGQEGASSSRRNLHVRGDGEGHIGKAASTHASVGIRPSVSAAPTRSEQPAVPSLVTKPWPPNDAVEALQKRLKKLHGTKRSHGAVQVLHHVAGTGIARRAAVQTGGARRRLGRAIAGGRRRFPLLRCMAA